MSINLTRLRHLVAIDRAGSLTDAAAAIAITQSALTKSVAAVEEELGYPLFERKARGVVATVEGREFIDRARRIVAELDLLVDDARRHYRRERKMLNIGICPPALEPYLSRVLVEMVRSFPEICLHLTTLTPERALRLLKRGDIHLLVGAESLFDHEPHMAISRIGDLQAYLFVRHGHPVLSMEAISTSNFCQYRTITPELMPDYGARLEEAYRRAGEDPIERISVIDHFPLMAAIVRQSDRVGIVGSHFSRQAQFVRQFTAILPSFFDTMPVVCATLPDNANMNLCRLFTRSLEIVWRERFQSLATP